MRMFLRILMVLPLLLLLPGVESNADPGELTKYELRIDSMGVRAARSFTTGLPPRWLFRLRARFLPDRESPFDPMQDDFSLDLFDSVTFGGFSPLHIEIPAGSPEWRSARSGRIQRWSSGPPSPSSATTLLVIDRERGRLSLTILPPRPSPTGAGPGESLVDGFYPWYSYEPWGLRVGASASLGPTWVGGECALRETGPGRWDFRLQRGAGGPEANERRAVATLRKIFEAQTRLKEGVLIDVDQDGIGEYGTLSELAGLVGVRASVLLGYPRGTDFTVQGPPISPPLLDRPFGSIDYNGFSVQDGYAFMVFLPNRDLPAGFSNEYGPASMIGLSEEIGIAASESAWCAYAQPNQRTGTGFRRFFVNQDGTVLESANSTTRYQGTNTPISGNSAFRGSGITSAIAVGSKGNDGDVWTVVE